MYWMKQKHTPDPAKQLPPADGGRLVAEQSLGRGTLGTLAVALLLCWVWALVAMTTASVFPWFTIPMGALIGIAMQRFGRGLSWHYPVVAAVIAGLAAYAGNLLIGVFETGRYIEATPVEVLRGLSSDTLRNFFRNTINPVDHIYAFSGCGVAAFFANRRLKRHEVLGLRNFERENK
jgi:hypothetical protein